MENPVENEAKQRVRLTGLSYQLLEKVRRGEGIYDEVHLANYLYRVDRNPGMFLSRVKMGSPAVEGSFNWLLDNGYLETYQDASLDWWESQFAEPEVIEEDTFSELDEFVILEKGEKLLEWLSNWRELTPPNDKIAYYLDKFKKDEDIPTWALRGLVRDGYMEKIKRNLDEEYEVEQWS